MFMLLPGGIHAETAVQSKPIQTDYLNSIKITFLSWSTGSTKISYERALPKLNQSTELCGSLICAGYDKYKNDKGYLPLSTSDEGKQMIEELNQYPGKEFAALCIRECHINKDKLEIYHKILNEMKQKGYARAMQDNGLQPEQIPK